MKKAQSELHMKADAAQWFATEDEGCKHAHGAASSMHMGGNQHINL